MKRIKIVSNGPTSTVISMPNWMLWFFKRFADISTERKASFPEGQSLSYVILDESDNLEFTQIFERNIK